MDAIDPKQSVLVLVDYQARLMPAIHQSDRVIEVARLLAQAARVLGIRVVGTEENPAGLGPNVEPVRALCDVTIAKTRFDACEGGLIEALEAGPPSGSVVIAGCEAHVCLMQTALGLLRHRRKVWVVEAGCGSRRASDHRLAMQRLSGAGATLVSPEMVLFEWLRDCAHPQFRQVLQLVKAADARDGA